MKTILHGLLAVAALTAITFVPSAPSQAHTIGQLHIHVYNADCRFTEVLIKSNAADRRKYNKLVAAGWRDIGDCLVPPRDTVRVARSRDGTRCA